MPAAEMFFGKVGNAAERVAGAIRAAREHLFSTQHEDGYWCGELEADTTLESDYILLRVLLGTVDEERRNARARYLAHQNRMADGPSSTAAHRTSARHVKAYFGLKLAGLQA